MKNKFADMVKSTISLKAYAMARTIETDPLQSFMFRVSIPESGIEMGFKKVAGISREMAVVEYLESMYEHTYKLAGREKVGDITFERGMYADDNMEKLFDRIVYDVTSRCTVIISIMDRGGNVRRTFSCAECWFSKYECGDLDSGSDDVIIETVTMTFEFFNRT